MSDMTTIYRLDDPLRFHQTALRVRAQRQEILTANIANADTPHFKARDLDFKAALQGALGGRGGSLALARTAPRHLPASANASFAGPPLYRGETQSSVDGNTVDLDVERAQFAENAIQYEASLTFINGLLRTMQTAIQGQ